jgi:hypothetical protein
VEPPVVAPPAAATAAATPLSDAAAHGYPLALTARPLLLPAGAVEGSAMVILDRVPITDMDHLVTLTVAPWLRYATPAVELEAGARLGLYQGSVPATVGSLAKFERLGALFVAVRHGFGADLSLGGELTVALPASDTPSFAPRLVVANKRHLAPWSAVELAAAAGIDRQTLAAGAGTPATSITSAVLGGTLRVQAQLTGAVGVEGRATFSFIDPVAEVAGGGGPSTTAYFAQNYGVQVVAAVSPNIDLIAGVDVIAANALTQYTVGVVARRLP